MSNKNKKNDKESNKYAECETRFGVLCPWGGDFRPTPKETSVRKLRVSLSKKTLRGFDFR